MTFPHLDLAGELPRPQSLAEIERQEFAADEEAISLEEGLTTDLNPLRQRPQILIFFLPRALFLFACGQSPICGGLRLRGSFLHSA